MRAQAQPLLATTSSKLSAVRAEVDRYYSSRLQRFGASPLGVGWTCAPTQELRFLWLTKHFDFDQKISLNDIGCGYGALLRFLRKRHRKTSIDYLGLDLSAAMVDEARRRWGRVPQARFALSGAPYPCADYCVASGIFNVKLGHDRSLWEEFVAETLSEMYANCRIATAVNFLKEDGTLDEIPELYRCVPAKWIEHCRRMGASVELHDKYGMLEFTLVLRRH